MTPMTSPGLAAPALCGALLLALGALAGCSGSDELFPDAPGMRWEYAVERSTSDGVRRFRYFLQTMPVTEDDSLVVHRSGSGNMLFYRRDRDGVALIARQRRGEAREPEAEPRRELAFPLFEGRRWQSPVRTSTLENVGPPQETRYRIEVDVPVRFEVVSTSASVRVPAGQFHGCVLVRGRGSVSTDAGNYVGRTRVTVRTRRWYAAGVGLVRLEQHETTTDSTLARGALIMELRRL